MAPPGSQEAETGMRVKPFPARQFSDMVRDDLPSSSDLNRAVEMIRAVEALPESTQTENAAQL